MRPALVAVILLAVAAAGCTRGGRGKATPAADPCAAERAEIRRLIDSAPRACTKTTDCQMYPGGPVDCGGVVDAATAARLWELTEAFRAKDCNYAVHCGPRAAQAACRAGRCVEEQLAGPGGRRP
jgi:hypothetical protein